jgi:hypothetical protein
MLRYACIIGVVVALSTGPMLAQNKTPKDKKTTAAKVKKAQPKKAANSAPKKDAAKTNKLTITAVSVTGIAEQRSASKKDAKWTRIKSGDTLNEMTIIRTGLGAGVVLKFSSRNNVVTINSGTKIGIAAFRKTGKLVQTTLGLKYGAIGAKVDSSRGANDFRVQTAVGTLAATGTGGFMAQWGDFSFRAQGTEGTWEQVIGHRILSLIAGQWTDADLTRPLDELLARFGIIIGDQFGGLTPRELRNLLRNGGGRGIISFVGNSHANNAPRLIRRITTTPTTVTPVQDPVEGGGPVGGGDPNRYGDDPEYR